MGERPFPSLIRLRPWPDVLYVSQGRSVLATGRDAFVGDDPQTGFFVHQTRLLSCYCYRIDGQPWKPVALQGLLGVGPQVAAALVRRAGIGLRRAARPASAEPVVTNCRIC